MVGRAIRSFDISSAADKDVGRGGRFSWEGVGGDENPSAFLRGRILFRVTIFLPPGLRLGAFRRCPK